jgi:hypothetical protein
VVLNVTVTAPQAAGYATVFPCGATVPTASNLNYAQAQTIPNLVVAKLSSTGSVCLFTLSPAHFIVDVSGYFPTGAIEPLASPARLLDTRPGEATFDGAFAGVGAIAGGTSLAIDVAGRANIPADASAVVLNLTAVTPDGSGFATIYPCGASVPTASSVNYATGQVIPNAVVAKIGAGGQICLFTLSRSHFLIDVAGYFPSGTFEPLATPARILETRAGQTTADGQFQGTGRRPGGSSLRLDVSGRVNIPADASAVVLNVTAILPQGFGYATVFPRGVTTPRASNLNYAPGQIIPNAVIAKLGVGGDVCLFTLADSDYVVDVTGFLIGGAPAADGPDCPAPLPPPTTTTTTTVAPATTTTTLPSNCHPSYPTVCIPPPPPDLNCTNITFRRFTVLPPDPHGFDTDNDGIGCETG